MLSKPKQNMNRFMKRYLKHESTAKMQAIKMFIVHFTSHLLSYYYIHTKYEPNLNYNFLINFYYNLSLFYFHVITLDTCTLHTNANTDIGLNWIALILNTLKSTFSCCFFIFVNIGMLAKSEPVSMNFWYCSKNLVLLFHIFFLIC